MSFLPEDYKEPVNTQYMDFADGDSVFRVLGNAKLGFEYWVLDEGDSKNKPYRCEDKNDIPDDKVVLDQYGKPNKYFFWAFPVYNVGDKAIQLLRVRQSTVRTGMIKFTTNPKWGDPRDYDFIVSRDQDAKPMYTVTVNPKEKLDKAVLEAFKDSGYDVERWFAGGDAFEQQDSSDQLAEDADEAMK